MKLQVTANFYVALMRVKIIWKLTHKTQDTVDNLRSEEQGPAAVAHAPTVLRKCRQIATRDVSPQGFRPRRGISENEPTGNPAVGISLTSALIDTEERISGRREPDPESPIQRQVVVIRCRKGYVG